MNGKRVMKTKQPVALVALLVLLCCTVAGTLAYLVDKTPEVKNTFEPAKVTTAVDEKFDGTTKSEVKIKNTGNIPAYIRAAVIVNWADKDGNVSATPVKDGDYVIKYDSSNTWKKIGDYWYYTKPVAADSLTEKALIESCAPVAGKAPEGYNLQVTILADGIQSEPLTAIKEAWHVDPATWTAIKG